MSDIRRYKRRYAIDGWPIIDTELNSILGTDDLVVILNNQEAAHKKQKAEIEKLKSSNASAWQQAEAAQKDRNRYGLQISAALRGEKHPLEHEDDGRLQAVREMALKLQEIESDRP